MSRIPDMTNAPAARKRAHLARLGAVAAAVTLGATACGSDSGSLPVIRLGAGSSPENAAADVATSDRMSMIAWIEYELGADLPPLDDDAEGWSLRAEVTTSTVRDLARVFDVPGDVVEQPADRGGGWMVGEQDGSTPSLWVSSDGVGWWSYSQAWNDMRAPVACVDPVDPSGNTGSSAGGGISGKGGGSDVPATGEVAPDQPAVSGESPPVVDPPACAEPEPPQNVPNANEAEDMFGALLSDLGVSGDDLTIESSADQWGAWVNATRRIDGMPSPLSWSASYGENGELTYAGGTLAEPTSIGDVPRIGTAAAFERLTSTDGGWWNVAPLAASTGGAAAVASDVARDSTGGSAAASSAVPAPGSDVQIDPAIDPMPVAPGEPITATIVDVEPSLWSVWDVDQTVWLLPAYDFIDTNGARYTVPAVPDDMIDSSAVDAAAVPPATDITAAPPESITPPEAPMTSDPATDFPGGVDALIGETEADATAAVEAAGFTARVVERDGESFPITMDYRVDRVNLTVQDGLVTVATIG